MAVLSGMKRRALFAAGIGMRAAPKATFIGHGGTVASGITAILAPGQMQGHMAFHVEPDWGGSLRHG